MTREAVVEGFEQFVDDAIEQTAVEFSVSRVLRQGVRGPGGAAVDRLVSNSDLVWDQVVQPELDSYRRQTVAQFEVVLDWVESDEAIDAFREEILATGTFADAIREDLSPERRDRVTDRLMTHHSELGNAVRPLVHAPESSFWAAVQSEFTREEAAHLVEEQFAFTGPLREHRDAFKLATGIDADDLLGGLAGVFGPSTIEVEYTDEAIRSMRRAERSVIREARRELARQFDEPA